MRSTHNTIRAFVIAIGLTLLVVTGTAAMMAAFSTTPPATDVYRRVALTPTFEPATRVATGHDSVLYERVVLADGRVQWVLTEEPGTSLATLAQQAAPAAAQDNNTSGIFSGAARTVSYTLVVKPAGLSKAIKNCSRSAYVAYDIACNTLS
jgi:hypothetical protein